MSNITPFVFEGHDVTVITDDDGELHFVAMEVAEILGYSDAYEMTKRLDDDEKSNRQIAGLGSPTGGRGVSIISESGLYSAILGSTKSQAKPFQKWVRGEVLPSIRKTGSYSMVPRAPVELSRMEILQIALESEQRRIEAEAGRDQAIATKAEIGSRREATSMATASTAVRQVNRLRHELGRNRHHATIIAVEKAISRKFGQQGWRPLKKWCDIHDAQPNSVTDPRYGEVKAWPADAWGEVYGIDLEELFPDVELELA